MEHFHHGVAVPAVTVSACPEPWNTSLPEYRLLLVQEPHKSLFDLKHNISCQQHHSGGTQWGINVQGWSETPGGLVQRKQAAAKWRRWSCFSGSHDLSVLPSAAEDMKFLGVQISQDMSWNKNTSAIIRQSQPRLCFMRKLKGASSGLSTQVWWRRASWHTASPHGAPAAVCQTEKPWRGYSGGLKRSLEFPSRLSSTSSRATVGAGHWTFPP